MSKAPALNSVLSGFLSITPSNANLTAIAAAFNNTVSRDGSTPNYMQADLDLNSNNVINLLDPVNPQDAATKAYVDLHAGVAGGLLQAANNLSDLISVSAARTNLGLSSLATAPNVSSYLAQGNNVTLVTSGNVTTINASLAGGTVSSVAGSSTDGELVAFSGTGGATIKRTSTVPSANGLSLVSASNYAGMLTLLGITTAGTTALGTSGATIPLLSTANTWSLAQTFTTAPVFSNVSGTQSALSLVPGTNVEPFGAYTAQNNQTGTTYTLVLTDQGKLVTMNNASANTLTIPLNSSVAFPVLTRIDLISLGAGITTIAATGGVTLHSAGSAVTLRTQYSGGSLVKIATDTWQLVGDIA